MELIDIVFSVSRNFGKNNLWFTTQGFQNNESAANGAPAVASMLTAGYFFFSIKAGKEPSVLFIGSQPATSDL
jgi:hypothetical protein